MRGPNDEDDNDAYMRLVICRGLVGLARCLRKGVRAIPINSTWLGYAIFFPACFFGPTREAELFLPPFWPKEACAEEGKTNLVKESRCRSEPFQTGP